MNANHALPQPSTATCQPSRIGPELSPEAPLDGHRLIAEEVADAFSEMVGADPQRSELHLDVAFMVGQHLAERGHPGRWDRIDLPSLFAQVEAPRPAELAFVLAWMFSFLGRVDALPNRRVASYVDELERLAPPHRGLTHSFTSIRQMLAADLGARN